MNARRRSSLTLLIADGIAIAALIASVAIIAIRLSRDTDAPPSSGSAQRVADAPGDDPSAGREKLAPPDDCERKGITRPGEVEGSCFQTSGRLVHVVNRGTTLRLPEMEIALVSLRRTERRVENAVDVRVRMRIRSRLRGEVDLSIDRFGLRLIDKLFLADPIVNSFVEDAFVRSGERLSRGESATGSVTFRIPPEAAEGLNRDGEVYIAQFSDYSPKTAGHTVAVFRTYH